jgi:hypothetical protein
MPAPRPSGPPPHGVTGIRPVRPRRACGRAPQRGTRRTARNSEHAARILRERRRVPSFGMPAPRPSGPPPPARGHRHPVPSAHLGRVVAPRSAELGERRETRRIRRGFSENGAVFRVSGCRHPALWPARARGATGVPSYRPADPRTATGIPLPSPDSAPAPSAELGEWREARRIRRGCSEIGAVLRDSSPADARTPSLPTPGTRPGGRADTLPAYARDPEGRRPRSMPRGAGTPSRAGARAGSRARTTTATGPGCPGDVSGERIVRFR